MYRWLADLTVVLHGVFILFVVFGALLAFRWPRLLWIHVLAAVWGILIEWRGWLCPLTIFEVWLRERGGADAYDTGFIEHYLTPLIYPPALDRSIQLSL